MKVLITINSTWNVFNFRMGLIKRLQNSGYSVIALCPSDNYVDRIIEEGVIYFPISINSKGLNPIEDIALIKDYYLAFRSIKPDVVLSYTIKPNIYASFACSLLGIPVISNVSGLGTVFIRKSFASYVAQYLYRFSFAKSLWVFFQNNSDKVVFLKRKLVSDAKVSVIPGSGVDLAKFNCDRTDNFGLRFLFVGRLLGDKGIREFVEASKLLLIEFKDLEFLIVGELGYNNPTAISENEFTNWMENPSFKYLGKSDDIVKVLFTADIMVLPSYREGLSRSLIEAAAMKLPIVTTDVPGCREVVSDSINGYLCAPRSINSLYSAMKKMLLLSNEDRLRMGHESRKIAESLFDENIVIEKYLEKVNSIYAS